MILAQQNVQLLHNDGYATVFVHDGEHGGVSSVCIMLGSHVGSLSANLHLSPASARALAEAILANVPATRGTLDLSMAPEKVETSDIYRDTAEPIATSSVVTEVPAEGAARE